jgi:hypothetical protein
MMLVDVLALVLALAVALLLDARTRLLARRVEVLAGQVEQLAGELRPAERRVAALEALASASSPEDLFPTRMRPVLKIVRELRSDPRRPPSPG